MKIGDKEFKELVKIAVGKLGDDTLSELLKNDLAYQENSKRVDKAESKYLELDLSKEQREICNELFDSIYGGI